MRTYLLFIVLVMNIAHVFADGLIISSFVKSETDIKARSTMSKIGKNGKKCPLLRVSGGENLTFEGDIVGNVKYEDSFYWISMEDGADLLIVRNGNDDPLPIYTKDFEDIVSFESNSTYHLDLQIDKYEYNKTYKSEYSGRSGNHLYVDLGLSVLWATENLGATIPEGYGERFAWAELLSKKSFSWNNYKYKGSEEDDGENRCENCYSKYVDTYPSDNSSLIELDISDDAARHNWGYKWRLPTISELAELYYCCTFVWTSYKGTQGYVVTGPSGKSIFLPHNPSSEKMEIENKQFHDGTFWSSRNMIDSKCVEITQYLSSSYATTYGASDMLLIEGEIGCLSVGENYVDINFSPRYKGLLIRPVMEK